MVWILTVVALLVAGIAYLIIMEDRPRKFRGRDLNFIRDLARSISMDHAEGSTLEMSSPQHPQLIELVKGPDTGDETQELRLRVLGRCMSEDERQAVILALREKADQFVSESWNDRAAEECLEVPIHGTPEEIGVQAAALAETVVQELQKGDIERFNFRVVGEIDMKVWGRMNKDALEHASHGGPLMRWLARKLRRMAERSQ